MRRTTFFLISCALASQLVFAQQTDGKDLKARLVMRDTI
jgi:hypothetical protein